jgi:hypothetical protein
MPATALANGGILSFMQIILNIPDEIANSIAPEGKDPARVALEALALEGYRSRALSESEVREMLGFRTRLQVHAFLKQHGVYLYDLDDFEEDKAAASRLFARLQAERTPSTSR